MISRTKIVLGLAAAALSASVVAPAVAQAAPATGSFTFCNASPNPEQVTFPRRGGYSSPVVRAYACWTRSFSGLSQDLAVVRRLEGSSWVLVGDHYFNDADRVYYDV